MPVALPLVPMMVAVVEPVGVPPDVPTIEVHAMNRTDVEPAGAGETPIIGIAPAIGNAVYHAAAIRLRAMPMKLPSTEKA